MRERPILFAGPMVRAIINGEKTVTRRVMKPQPTPSNLGGHSWPCPIHQTMLHVEQELQNGEGIWAGLADSACPHGAPGDLLWVRETYGDAGCRLTYRADLDDGAHCMVKKWIPSIHMPRSASRILLEITAVRVERLQDISDDQARAEGVAEWAKGALSPEGRADICRQEGFRMLWESINGAESWAANPWVWVIEFKRITP
ncbi:ASCH domain-containing protein [Metapseudomonas otitidis]|uniref:hypothetical protein n=1 Tax=Metapseudomonas otitidis TaxID=319939 RepID=UPI001AAED89C|nr:hypothetical protein [Pseudomonas otitidis]MBO2925967.1 hypothetical protein [Pseudomonas otitidis]